MGLKPREVQYTLSTSLKSQGPVFRGDRNVGWKQGSYPVCWQPHLPLRFLPWPSSTGSYLKPMCHHEISGNWGFTVAAIRPITGQPRCQHAQRRSGYRGRLSCCSHWGGLGEDEGTVLRSSLLVAHIVLIIGEEALCTIS